MTEEKTYSISGLNRAIGNLFARHTPAQGFWVRGDIQRLSVSRQGHCYFELVERDPFRQEPRAVASAMVWSKRKIEIDRALGGYGLALADDLSVRVRVRVSFYEATGKVQVDVLDIDPMFTAGDLAVARERVRRALRADGLFDANRRLPFPVVPLRISLVTSAGSAAWHDFMHELAGGGYAFEVQLVDTRVSGPGAAGELASAIRRAGQAADVVVVVRGGGARSELSAFDAEPVARAVAAAPVPVWIGVGHEIDRSICDEVAHRCFKTPTATAQALVAAVADFDRGLDQLRRRVEQGSARRLATAEAAVEARHQRLRAGSVAVLDRLGLGLERTATAVAAAPGRHLRAEEARLDTLVAQVRALDPERVLARGYSITRAADGAVVRDAAALAAGDRVTTRLAAGSIEAVVETVAAPVPEERG